MHRTFSEPYTPAGFEALKKPFLIIPKRNGTGQVEFFVEGEGIDEALNEIYQNAPVGILDYIKSLKGLRSSIFALKGSKP